MVPAIDIRRLWFAVLLAACTAAPPPLNSDRIERKFGSYGVQILSAETTRISCLYSEGPDGRTCRTIAVVEFGTPLPDDVATVHERILEGASIGAEIRDAGWPIRKSQHRVYTAPLPAQLEKYWSSMKLDPGTQLATHRYLFEIRLEARWIAYATITEMHHPDYLTAAELTAIYVRD